MQQNRRITTSPPSSQPARAAKQATANASAPAAQPKQFRTATGRTLTKTAENAPKQRLTLLTAPSTCPTNCGAARGSMSGNDYAGRSAPGSGTGGKAVESGRAYLAPSTYPVAEAPKEEPVAAKPEKAPGADRQKGGPTRRSVVPLPKEPPAMRQRQRGLTPLVAPPTGPTVEPRRIIRNRQGVMLAPSTLPKKESR